MKKSSAVPATLIAALAASLLTAGCNTRNRECRDATGKVLPDSQCTGGVRGASWYYYPRTSSGGFGGSGSVGG